MQRDLPRLKITLRPSAAFGTPATEQGPPPAARERETREATSGARTAGSAHSASEAAELLESEEAAYETLGTVERGCDLKVWRIDPGKLVNNGTLTLHKKRSKLRPSVDWTECYNRWGAR